MNLDYWAKRMGLESGRDLWGEVFLIRRRYNENHESGASIATFITDSLKAMSLGGPDRSREFSLQSCIDRKDDFDEQGLVSFCSARIDNPVDVAIFNEYMEMIEKELTGDARVLFRRLKNPSKKIKDKFCGKGGVLTIRKLGRGLGSSRTYWLFRKKIIPVVERVMNER